MSYLFFSFQVTEPLETGWLDLVGKLTLTGGGNQYICVMVDYYTKWADAYPMKSKTVVDVTNYTLDFFYNMAHLKDRPGHGVQ